MAVVRNDRLVLGLFTLLGAVTALAWARSRKTRPLVVFTTAAVGRQAFQERVSADGEVQPCTRVNVSTTISAIIKELHVREGQWVKAGDLLVSLDRTRHRQELDRADQGLRLARLDLEKAEAIWRKAEEAHWCLERLSQEKLVAFEDFQKSALERDRAALERDRRRLAVAQARAEVALTQEALERTIIRAPIAGRITDLCARQGQLAVAGSSSLTGVVLMVLVQMEELLAEIRVSEGDVVKLRAGQRAEVQIPALPGQVFQGQVLDVGNGLHPADLPCLAGAMPLQTYRVRVRILDRASDTDRLRPGMSARVRVKVGAPREVVTVPRQAVQERLAGPEGGVRAIVFAVRDNRVEARQLRLGNQQRHTVEVLEGLLPSDVIVTGPQAALPTLATGQRIRAVNLPN